MSTRLRAALVGMGCLACCLSLVLGVAGATTGIAGAVAAWLGRYEIAIVSLIGIAVVSSIAVRELQTPQSNDATREEEDTLT